MAISVMIQRTFGDKEKAAKLAPLIVKIRSLATIQPGYITGKTFNDWNRWLQSEQRMALQKQIDDLLGEATRYRIYEPLVGGIIPQFQAVTELVARST